MAAEIILGHKAIATRGAFKLEPQERAALLEILLGVVVVGAGKDPLYATVTASMLPEAVRQR